MYDSSSLFEKKNSGRGKPVEAYVDCVPCVSPDEEEG